MGAATGVFSPDGEAGGPVIDITAATVVVGAVVEVMDWQLGRKKKELELVYDLYKQVAGGAIKLAGNIWDVANSPSKPNPIGYIPPTATTSQVGYVQATSAQGYFSIVYGYSAAPGQSTTATAFNVSSLSIDKEYFTDMPWPGTTGNAIIIRGYTATGAYNYAYPLQTQGPGKILFDGPVAPAIILEYLRFIWHPSNGIPEELSVIPYEFVGPSPGEEPRVPSFPLTAPVPTVLPTVVPAPQPQPPPERKVVPEIAPNTTPSPTPAPIPGPQPSPNPQTTPQPATTPTTTPAPFVPVVVPQVTPNRTTQTNADGSRKTAALPGVITTPAGNEKIGPVTVTTNAPQATLAGIAGEVGRIEQKLAKMIRPPADGDLTDRLGLLASLLKALYDEFLTGLPAGGYILSSPCEKDEQGQRVEYEVPILSTNNRFDAIYERLDALADLIQTHKDLKQPICRGTQPTGQPVTVNFTQIE